MVAVGANPDPGWYPDPSQHYEHRYWDGSAWTDQVATAGTQTTDPDFAPVPVETQPVASGTLEPDTVEPEPVAPEATATDTGAGPGESAESLYRADVETLGEPIFEYSPVTAAVTKLLSKRTRERDRSGTNLRVRTGPHGLVFRFEGTTMAVRWDDAAAVWQATTEHRIHGSPSYIDHRYTLRTTDGRVLKIVGNQNAKDDTRRTPLPAGTPGTTTPISVEQLGRIIQREVTPRAITRAADRLNHGEAVTFGPLVVDLERLGNGEESIGWDVIEDVQIRQGVISVKRQGKWLAWQKVGVASVPNVFAFVEIVTAVRALYARNHS